MPTKCYQIGFIGAGNVAHHLGQALLQAGHTIKQVWSRKEAHAKTLAKPLEAAPITDLEKIDDNVDILIIAVPDDAIESIASELSLEEQIVIHSSGMTDRQILESASSHNGVFYPLQTFSKQRPVDFSAIPVFIETDDKKVQQVLIDIATSLGCSHKVINAEQRQTLHLAAVFSNNFTNHLQSIAQNLLSGKGLTMGALKPLLKETIAKLDDLSPDEAQTGPAIRGDQSTIRQHLQELAQYPGYQRIYKLLTQSLQEYFDVGAQTEPPEDHFLKRLSCISTLVFDLDGVLTDGVGIVTQGSEVMRKLNSKDAYVLQLATKQGFRVAIISGAQPTGVQHRLKRLGVQHIFTDSADKIDVFDEFVEKYELKHREILYMGDDIPDLKVFKKAGVSVCPNDAATELIESADYVSPYGGGKGAVRDIVEKILRLQNKWMDENAHIW